ncbi:DUF6009 family protein [Streptomyces sp. NPDC048411]
MSVLIEAGQLAYENTLIRLEDTEALEFVRQSLHRRDPRTGQPPTRA